MAHPLGGQSCAKKFLFSVSHAGFGSMSNTPEQWLDHEDQVQRQARIERLKWLEKQMPEVQWVAFCTGAISKSLFEEARYCFVYGQYLASILLALSFIEQSLAGYFYGIGRNDLEKASLSDLANEARKLGLISDRDIEALRKAWKIRKPVTHFRRPGHPERVEARAYYEGPTHFYNIIEKDARAVMALTFRLLLKITPWSSSKLPDQSET
jgi:hypothetical protein